MAMVTCDGWIFLSMAMVVLLIAPLDSTSTEKIDAKIDIVVLMLGRNRTYGALTAAAYKRLATYFEFGQDKVRFAIVQTPYATGDTNQFLINDREFILMNLSDSQALYEKTLDDYEVPSRVVAYPRHRWYWISIANWTLKTEVFQNTTSPGRPKILVAIFKVYPALTENLDAVKGYSPDELGIWYYHVKKFQYENQKYTWKVNDTELIAVKEAIRKDLCNKSSSWDSACRYLEKGPSNCGFEWWNRYMNKPEQCDDVHPKPTATKNCTNDDCVTECNRRWPANCTGKCGPQVARPGNAPQKMEHCQKIDCPPCATWPIIVGVIGGIALLTVLVFILVAATRKKKPKEAPVKSVSTSMTKKSGGSIIKPIPTSRMKSSRSRKDPPGKEAAVAAGGRGGHAAVSADRSVTQTRRGKPARVRYIEI